jgi:hypothetical protein
MMDTISKLNLISVYRIELESLNSDQQKLIDSVMTDEIKKQLADIETSFSDKKANVTEQISELEAEVRQEVLVAKKTFTGDKLMAVWNKGRISWDAKGLDGFAVAHPEIKAFRKEGDPSVTMRKVGKGE